MGWRELYTGCLFDGEFARATRDIDLLAKNMPNNVEDMKRVFENIFSIECDDALKFDHVCVSTHGCIRSKRDRELWRIGTEEMLRVLEPTDVLVHGYMPDDVFGKFYDYANFHRYPSLFEKTHKKEEDE